ncbi:MAG: SDR family NAD(P)-dependent oxidoreductase [Verrucomicrobiaceae bacterium]|nr:SDR family NAD(P)-dependent oxidoreductase [Verrucomicrobiaceae bacterium]
MNKKVIIITGASSGMGKDGALRLIKEGHIVYAGARSVDQMSDLMQAGGRAVALDVTDQSSIKTVVDTVIREQGRIDVLWNNAGYSVMGAVEDVSDADARRQFDVNLFGVAEMTKAVLPQMRAQKSGLIINTTSVGGKIFTAIGAWYHASKHALEGWSDCLRLEVEQFGINVVVLEPGGVKTAFGSTAKEPLLARAKGGAYEGLTRRVADTFERMYAPSNTTMSPPSVISDTVVKIINSKRPRTRYAAGYMANMTLFLRWLLSDRLFERVIMGQYK